MPRIKFVARKLICAGLLAAGCACIWAVPAAAEPLHWPLVLSDSAGITADNCLVPALIQPFLSWKDQSYYVLAPGQAPDSFTGDGWTLSGGASVVTTNLADGSTNTVLDLPSGSMAVSPTMCVGSTYPTARTMFRDVKGPDGVNFYVSYQGTPSWKLPHNTGKITAPPGAAWTVSKRINLQPTKLPGWQLARFALVAGGASSEFQVYNFYVDPYRKG